jgi:PAS domain S-box-containing protein
MVANRRPHGDSPDRTSDASRQLSLTERESDVLVRVQRGLENKTIAFELGMAEQSVKEYVSVLLRKFGVSNRTALAGAASRLEVTGDREMDRSWLPQFFIGAEPQIAVVRGPDLRFEAVNDTFRRAVGDRPVIGRTLREAFPELEGQDIVERCEQVYATGEPAIEHERVTSWDRGNGIERRQVDLVIQPLRDEDGIVNGVMSFAIDVTDLAAARRSAALVREEFSTVLDLVPSGIMIVDETGRIVTMNAAAQRIARLEIDRARPAPEQFAEAYAIQDASGNRVNALDTPLSRALRGETVMDEVHAFVGGGAPLEVRVRTTARPLRDPDGLIRGAIAVFTEL